MSFDMVHCSRCSLDWHENGTTLVFFFLFLNALLGFVSIGTKDSHLGLILQMRGWSRSSKDKHNARAPSYIYKPLHFVVSRFLDSCSLRRMQLNLSLMM
ncbi:hypothetical protein AXX17_AT5G02320 [Arabidopsis thaliana]|uniref:Transmembrane protein n=1 Tax=Arabidopsis thaliana TaxID=3702 RepID=A0A178UCP5_ARATH|nr:hypothetical protein AXX17_AT5G02320 [Arabidopsis thaliana]